MELVVCDKSMDNLLKIKNLLKKDPNGLNIREISEKLDINRNSVAKLLDILTAKEEVEIRVFGRSKVYFLVKPLDYRKWFELLSRTTEELNNFPFDGDIYAFIAGTLKRIAPENTIILINSFEQDTKTVTLKAVEGLGQRQADVEAILCRPLNGIVFSVPDRILPEMLTGECNEIPGGLTGLTFGWLPYETCKKIESLPFFGKVYSSGISWKGRLNGSATFILPREAELENHDLITFFIRQVAGFLVRRDAERALVENEAKYRALFTAESDAIFVVDKESGTISDCNDAATRMYGYRKDELIGQSNTIVSAEPDATRSATAEPPRTILLRYHHKKDGSIFPVEIMISVITLQGRSVIITAIRDITERKRAEDALLQVNKKLNLLNSITRHDILNQIFALKAYLQISKKTLDDPARISEFILKEEHAVTAIEHQILFTREYQDVGVKAPSWQNVFDSIKRAIARLPMQKIIVDADRTDLEVFADPLFEKVFYNLIDNALKYGGNHLTTIRIFSRESDQGLIITCEDDGVGITRDDKKRLFERGFGKHTGLGLYLTREILSITGITITEIGVPGKGARFEIMVPNGAWRFIKKIIG